MKINRAKIEKAIAKCRRNLKSGERVKILFSEKNGEIVFSGHAWNHNCFYTVEDMKENRDFAVYQGDGSGDDWETSGMSVSLTSEEKDILGEITINA